MRLTKIYTRQGDKGETRFAGKRIAKDEAIIEVIGAIDELNSAIGLMLAFEIHDLSIKEYLTKVQHKLFDLGGELHSPEYVAVSADHITDLENFLDSINKTLPPLTEFVLPRGTPAAAACHLARTICRRAERNMVTLHRDNALTNPEMLRYLNRLSDLLFVIARALTRHESIDEPLWEHGE